MFLGPLLMYLDQKILPVSTQCFLVIAVSLSQFFHVSQQIDRDHVWECEYMWVWV